MDEEQRWANTGLAISAGTHAFLAVAALLAGALFSAPDDEPIQILQSAIITEEEFAELVGDERQAEEPPVEALASIEPPEPAEAEPAEPAEPAEAELQEPPEAQDPPEEQETDLAKAPYEVAPPPPAKPALDPRAAKDALPSEDIRQELARVDPSVFQDPEKLQDPKQDDLAQADISDRLEKEPCVAAEELRAQCAKNAGSCAPGAPLTEQLRRAEQACQQKEEQLAEEKRREEEAERQRQEAERLAEEKRQEEARQKARAEKQRLTRKALRLAVAEARRKEKRRLAALRRKQAERKRLAEAGADLIDDLLGLDAGGQVVQREPSAVVGEGAELNAGEKASLSFNFKREWLAPDPDALDVLQLVVELEVRLDRNGNVIGEPRTLQPTGALTTRQINAIFNAKRAVTAGAPHKGPPEKYVRWRKIHIKYDPVRQEATIN